MRESLTVFSVHIVVHRLFGTMLTLLIRLFGTMVNILTFGLELLGKGSTLGNLHGHLGVMFHMLLLSFFLSSAHTARSFGDV